jgi:eukaryotic-like serine/threonine-protein kinase
VLRHVHAAGYLHRDIKPSNIGYTSDGSPKLLDFGLAQMIADVSEASSTQSVKTGVSTTQLPTIDAPVEYSVGHQLIGTPAYMSPEVVTSGPITPAIDLWSLAVTMYEALTGTQPFRAPTIAETIHLILAGELKDARILRSDCPPSIAEFLASALARGRYRRPQTAVEFLNRLTAARAAVPLNVTARPVSA